MEPPSGPADPAPKNAVPGPGPAPSRAPIIDHGPFGSEPQSVIRRGLAVVLALLLLGLDLWLATGLTGVLAVLAMFGLIIGLLAGLLRARSRRIRRVVAALVGADAVILLALLAMFVARGYMLSQQFGSSTPEIDRAARIYDIVFLVIGALQGFSAAMPARLARLALRLAQKPAVLLAGSFAAMILVGTLALTLPVSLEDVRDVSFVNSLFTVTSAVCVTGLTVNDPGTTYTFFGELVILLSIQLGGIGIMTLAALALAFARDSALSTQLRYAAMLDARTLTDLRATVQSIIVGTLAIETLGALLLWIQFAGDPRVDEHSAAWMAVFHSVSAFCNAGFALFQGNLMQFQGDAGVQAVVMLLIVLGGLGFPVIREVVILSRHRVVRLIFADAPRGPHVSLSARVVLVVSGALILGGTALTLVLEWGHAFRELSVGDRVLAALFHAVNTRTSGFNTVDVGVFGPATLLWTCVLMFVGGSPGSTAGGIKTTTLATILATLRGELRGREPQLGHRAIAPEVFRRATAVAAISSGIVLVSLTALTLSEDQPFIRLLFEAVSAFGTVGLSTGITADLSLVGKLIISATMFVGRIGPLTIALAIADTAGARQPYRLARESLPIG